MDLTNTMDSKTLPNTLIREFEGGDLYVRATVGGASASNQTSGTLTNAFAGLQDDQWIIKEIFAYMQCGDLVGGGNFDWYEPTMSWMAEFDNITNQQLHFRNGMPLNYKLRQPLASPKITLNAYFPYYWNGADLLQARPSNYNIVVQWHLQQIVKKIY